MALVLVLSAASAVLGQTTHNDNSCDIGVSPAATLLLPYFEVHPDDRNGQNTIFTVINVTDTARVARVTLWTDFAYPVYSFNIYPTGYDMQTVNLHDVLNGRITNRRFGTGSWVSVHGEHTKKNRELEETCGRVPDTIPQFQIERMKSAFREGVVAPVSSPAHIGCNTVGGVHENAVGYATVDVVGNCSSALPNDPKYFTDDIRFDNVLVGDYQQVDPNQDFAQGSPMVHIRAIGEMRQGRFTTNLNDTFYSRFQSPARPHADARQPLPSTFAARWINGGGGDFQTTFKIWRQGVTTAASGCSEYRENGMLVLGESVAFDEDGNGEGLRPFECHFTCVGEPEIVTPTTSQISIAQIDAFPQDLIRSETAGWMYLNLAGNAGFSKERSTQAWVVVSMRAEGRYSVDVDAVSLGNGCTPTTALTEFTVNRGTVGLLPGPAPEVTPIP